MYKKKSDQKWIRQNLLGPVQYIQQPSYGGFGGGSGDSSGVSNLRDLEDVDVSNLFNGYVLSYDATLDKFVLVPPQIGGSLTTTFRTVINTLADTPVIINHNLNLPVKESLIINSFLDGEKVDVKIETLTVNSFRITTERATTNLFISVVGIL